MKLLTEQPIEKISAEELSNLALQAAKELSRGLKTKTKVQALARYIRAFFVSGQGRVHRPTLQPESIGLVCDVLERWKGERSVDYSKLSNITTEIAEKLENVTKTSRDLDELKGLCLSLYGATKSRPEVYDIQPRHRYLATLA